MEDILKRNIEVLSQRDAELAKRILLYPKDDKIRVHMTRIGSPTISLRNNSGKRIFIHSLYEPQQEAIRFVEAQGLKRGDTVVLFGLGLGYHIHQILSEIGEDGYLIGIEMNPSIFRVALETIEIAHLLNRPNLELVVSENPAYIREAITKWVAPRDPNRIKMLIHTPSIEILPDGMEEIKEFLRNTIFTRRSIHFFSDLVRENIKRNIDYIIGSPGIKGLFGRFPDTPITVVSAGPSLDNNLESLRRFRGRGVIVSSGKALKPLIDEEIRPHLVLITDPQAETYDQMKGFLDLDIPLVFIPSTCPQIIEKYRGPKIVALIEAEFIHPELADLRWEKGEIGGGGSVATTCLDIAIRMGGDPIILVGQDLSFPEGRSTHLVYTQWRNGWMA